MPGWDVAFKVLHRKEDVKSLFSIIWKCTQQFSYLNCHIFRKVEAWETELLYEWWRTSLQGEYTKMRVQVK